MNNSPQNHTNEWLKRLERESWHLELILSGASIFLLVQASRVFEDFAYSFLYDTPMPVYLAKFMFLGIICISQSITALTIFLILHLLIRSFWVAAIGLKSVQPSIDFTQFHYSPFFTRKLSKKVMSLDQLVIRLDQIGSVIFALAFFFIFMLIALGLFVLPLGMLESISENAESLGLGKMEGLIETTLNVALVVYGLFGLIYFIDFFSLGFIKKIRWLSKWYYPLYTFLGTITLAFITRSLYYSLISRFSKRQIWLGILVLILLPATQSDFGTSQYFPSRNSKAIIWENFYDDARETDQFVNQASIPSKFLDQPFLELFIPYTHQDNDNILTACPMLNIRMTQAFRYISGYIKGHEYNLTSQYFENGKYTQEELAILLDCHAAIYEISFNGCVYDQLTFHFYMHPHMHQKGLLTVIPTVDFLDGENRLVIKRLSADDEPEFKDYVEIPFWYKRE